METIMYDKPKDLDMLIAYSNGIWVGKRPLLGGKLYFGQELIPGLDVYHWCVMIKGTVYQVNVEDDHRFTIKISDDDDEKSTFKWYQVNYDIVEGEKKRLAKVAKVIEQRYTYSVLSMLQNPTSNAMNCQTFVVRMINCATDIEEEVIQGYLLSKQLFDKMRPFLE